MKPTLLTGISEGRGLQSKVGSDKQDREGGNDRGNDRLDREAGHTQCYGRARMGLVSLYLRGSGARKIKGWPARLVWAWYITDSLCRWIGHSALLPIVPMLLSLPYVK